MDDKYELRTKKSRAFSVACFIGITIFIAFASDATAGETITAIEEENFLFDGGEMKRGAGQFEITYYVEEDTVTQTRVFDVRKKKLYPTIPFTQGNTNCGPIHPTRFFQ